MTIMIPASNRLDGSVVGERQSPESTSSFKKPQTKDDHHEILKKEGAPTPPKRRGSFDLLRRTIKPSTKQPSNQNENCDSSLSTTEIPPPKKKLTFARTAKVKKVRSRYHYTAEERANVWHSVEEYTAIKKRCVQTLRLMMTDPDFQDDFHYTSRGLESRTKDAAKKRKEFKIFARELILEEQENQREAGVHSPGRLRNVYLEPSAIAIVQARELARRDETEKMNEPLDYIMKLIKFEYGWR